MSAGGLFPGGVAFNSVTIKNNQPAISTLASNGRTQVKTQLAQYWSFNASLPTLTRAQWAPIAAFTALQRGPRFSFTIRIPEYKDSLGALTTETVTINGAHSAGDTSVALSSGSINTTDALKAGDFVNFLGDHNKTYMVTSDVDFSSGSATMNIEPGLAVDCSGGETLIYKDVAFTVRFEEGVQEWNMGLASTVGYELEFREAL